MDHKERYHNLAKEYSEEEDKEERLLVRLSLLRLLTFFGGICIIYFSFLWSPFAGTVVTVVAIVLFLYIVKRYGAHVILKNHAHNLSRINDDESKVLDGDFSMFVNGDEYNDPAHDFTYDLDLFGDSSLFQYLNRTVTGYGRDVLAMWLKDPFEMAASVEERQKCVKELSAKFGWRQEFMATGTDKNLEKEGIDAITRWLSDTKEIVFSKVLKVLIYLLPSIAVVLLILAISGLINYSFLVTAILINLFVVGLKIRTTNKIYEELSGRYKYLEPLSSLLRLIGQEKFESPLLSGYSAGISTDNRSGIEALKQLGSIIHRFDNRINLLVGFFLNAFLLWDLQCVRQLSEWKRNYRDYFPEWLRVIGEIDALVSLGNYAYNNHDFAYPRKTDQSLTFLAKEMGHPLIPSHNRVDNDFSVTGRGEITIVTGANMAGKSTFLRTVAVNLVIAMVGAPVCAAEMIFSPVKIFTSMRTTDSLHSNESYFYAELKRLKILKERLAGEDDVFLILDEILKGTNSDDKRMGSALFLKEIIGMKGTGLIATHDTSLGDLENEYPGIIVNKCIEIEVDGVNIKFDYKIKHGIAKNKNAVLLMEQLGILDRC